MILDPIQDTIHFVVRSPSLPLTVTDSQISLAFDDIESFEMYFVELSTEICRIFFFIIRSLCLCVHVS